MTAHDPHSTSPFSGSLLDAQPELAATPTPADAPRAPRTFVPTWLMNLWNKPRLRWSSLAVLVLAIGISAFFYFRPRPQPDYALDPMDEVLDYTLLTDDFNNLPLDKRLELIRELIDRVKTMSADDSSMMAMFAAGIKDKMRQQLEKNASLIVMDVWDKYAWEYVAVPPDKREQHLDQTVVDLTKLMETLAGQESTKTDQERLDEARAQAKRDAAAIEKGNVPPGNQMARMMEMMRHGMQKNGSPTQQQRAQLLMRDMTRHLRGRDVVTGK